MQSDNDDLIDIWDNIQHGHEFDKIFDPGEGRLEKRGANTRDDMLRSALDRLCVADRVRIDRMAKTLVEIFKEREVFTRFNYYDGLEVLAKLGIFMVTNSIFQ